MKRGLVIPLIISIVILMGILVIFLVKGKDIFSNLKKNDLEIEKQVKIEKSEFSSFVFVTQESPSNHVININLTPFLTFNISEKEIKSFNISNFKATNTGDNEVILVHPTDLPIDTLSRTFLFTKQDDIKQENLKSSENSIEYIVTSEVKNFNEVVSKGTVSPYFGIIIKNIASVDYKAILERDSTFDGAKYLEYSEISLNDLDSNIQFDIYIEFTDGKKYSKRFTTDIKGESFKTETAPIFPISPVE